MQSAKTNLNVEQVFFSIARDIKQRLADTDSRAEVLPLHVSYCDLLNGSFHFGIGCSVSNAENYNCVLQPQTIKINQPDTGAGAGQVVQKSACCGS